MKIGQLSTSWELRRIENVRRLFRLHKWGWKQGAHKLSFNDKAWKEEAYPVYPPRVGLGGYQLLWLRKEVTLSKEALGEDLILHLGKL